MSSTRITTLALALVSAACTRPAITEETFATEQSSLTQFFGHAVRIAAGTYGSCAVLENGQVACWGLGVAGSQTSVRPQPALVPSLPDAARVAVGGAHVCAVLTEPTRDNETVFCWGSSDRGQVGIPESNPTPFSIRPLPIRGLEDATDVTAGDKHTCAMRATHEVVCWGAGSSGQLGDGGVADSSTPVAVAGLDDAVAIAAGDRHTCALRATGEVVCWGAGESGQLGDGGTTASPTAVAVAGLDATGLSAMGAHTCAVRRGGDVVCWGANESGQLGDGSFANAVTPVAVSGLTDVADISTGWFQTCARRVGGGVACWGSGFLGELGNGVAAGSAVPVAVSGLSDAVAISVGGDHACAIRQAGPVVCWGSSQFGQLGNGARDAPALPALVSGVGDATDVAPGTPFACAIRGGGQVRCWGSNQHGTLGDGTFATSKVPVAVSGLDDAISISAGDTHACVVRANSQVSCWGAGAEGELGNGTFTDSNVPVTVAGLSGVTAVAAGTTHTCALLSTREVVCWGGGGSGQLGDGNNRTSLVPVFVSGLSDAVAITAGVYHSCAVRETGAIVCWGGGPTGQLGDGNGGFASRPVAVVGISDATTVSGGLFHTCARRQTGEIACWGGNAFGQLGNGSSQDTLTPVAVSGVGDAIDVVAGGYHSCARRLGGELDCWGRGIDGELGDGRNSLSSTPRPVPGINGALALAAGGVNNCAVLSTHQIACWGASANGQIGDGSAPFSTTPAPVLALSDNIGMTCASDAGCFSGSCVDGVCCDKTCGGNNLGDCQACSVAAGASSNGVCTTLPATHVCRDTGTSLCDVAERCDGVSTTCPADVTTPGCVESLLSQCTPPVCTTESVNLNGGQGVVGGVTLTFGGGVTSGEISFTPCPTDSAPPTGFKIVVGTIGQYCWNIDTRASYTTPPLIHVCYQYLQKGLECPIGHYDPTSTVSECRFRLVHDDGSGYTLVQNYDLMTAQNRACGDVRSLSPFAIVEPIDTSAPVFTDAGDVVLYAATTSGAASAYIPPTATDDFDGHLPADCTPAPTSTFAPGQTTVNCTATDSSGNRATTSFTVWVQYQAPSDGTFFHQPIDPDGSSIFKRGSTVPVKFKLQGASAGIKNLAAQLFVANVSNGVTGPYAPAVSTTPCAGGNVFRYDPASRQYIFNLSTKAMPVGTWSLRADLGDGVDHVVKVSLR